MVDLTGDMAAKIEEVNRFEIYFGGRSTGLDETMNQRRRKIKMTLEFLVLGGSLHDSSQSLLSPDIHTLMNSLPHHSWSVRSIEGGSSDSM